MTKWIYKYKRRTEISIIQRGNLKVMGMVQGKADSIHVCPSAKERARAPEKVLSVKWDWVG